MSRFYDLMIGSARALAADTVPPPPEDGAQKDKPQQVKLDSNESPYGPSPRAVAAMLGVLDGSHQYPDDRALELRHRLAEKHGVDPRQILVAPGSSAILSSIGRTMLEPGLSAITSEQSFIMYRYAAQAAGGHLLEVPMRDRSFDLEGILDAIGDQTRVIFIANPNNPTGTFLDAAQIDAFLAHVPSHVMVVIDEAYHDYAQFFAKARNIEHPHSLDYVQEARNVVVLRTFSKAHGLAGARIGYGIGPAELMAYIANMQDTYAVSSVAQAGALAALEDEGHVRNAVQRNAEQAAWLSTELARMGYPVQPTWTNFLYCELGQDADPIVTRLHGDGIAIRSLAAWGARSAVRITVGTAEQNRALMSGLRQTLLPGSRS